MTSFTNIIETNIGKQEDNEKKAKMIAFLRERLLDYYKQKLIYYQTEIKHWKNNDTGEIPEEVIKSISADLEWEIKRKTF